MKLRIAIVGEFQTGKSTFVNLLFGRKVAQVGHGLPCTAFATRYRLDNKEQATIGGTNYDIGGWINSGDIHQNETLVEVGLNHPLLLSFDFMDTPGVDAAGKIGDLHEAITFAQIEAADAFILLIDKLPEINSDAGMSRLIIRLRDLGKPTFGFFNCGRLGDTEDPRSAATAETVGAVKVRLKEGGFPISVICDNLEGNYEGFSHESTRFSILLQIERVLMSSVSKQLHDLHLEINSIPDKLQALQNQINSLHGSRQRMEMGIYHFEPGWEIGKWEIGRGSGSGVRVHKLPRTFENPFSSKPELFLSTTKLDVSHSHNTRYNLFCEDITNYGFTLAIATWEDSEIYGIEIYWLAMENVHLDFLKK